MGEHSPILALLQLSPFPGTVTLFSFSAFPGTLTLFSFLVKDKHQLSLNVCELFITCSTSFIYNWLHTGKSTYKVF